MSIKSKIEHNRMMSMALQAEITHQLLVPVRFEGVTHEIITLRRIKAKDLRGLKTDNATIEEMLFLIVKLSGWPPEGVDELDQADLEAIGEIIASFSKARG